MKRITQEEFKMYPDTSIAIILLSDRLNEVVLELKELRLTHLKAKVSFEILNKQTPSWRLE